MPHPRKTTTATEAQTQALLISWWKLAHKGLGVPDQRLLVMIPNGAYLGGGVNNRGVALRAIRFAQLKRQGFVQGAPDLFLAVPRTVSPGLFIELKRAQGGTVARAQREVHELLRAQGYALKVAAGFESAVEHITAYLRG
jgi:hypothetical protein